MTARLRAAIAAIDLTHPDDRPNVVENLSRLLNKKHIEHDYRIVRPSGSVIWLHDRVSVVYDASRKLILKGVDGVVFVADSQIERTEANIESLENLRDNLEEQGYNLDKLPYVVQYNKRDLPNASPLSELEEVLNPTKVESFEAIATKGSGVFDTLKAVAKQVLTELKKGG